MSGACVPFCLATASRSRLTRLRILLEPAGQPLLCFLLEILAALSSNASVVPRQPLDRLCLQLVCRCAFFIRIGEHPNPIKFAILNKGQQLFKVFIRFAGKAGDERCSHGYAGTRCRTRSINLSRLARLPPRFINLSTFCEACCKGMSDT